MEQDARVFGPEDVDRMEDGEDGDDGLDSFHHKDSAKLDHVPHMSSNPNSKPAAL